MFNRTVKLSAKQVGLGYGGDTVDEEAERDEGAVWGQWGTGAVDPFASVL